MFSDLRRFPSAVTFAALGALALTASGCGLFRDKAPKNAPLKLGQGSTACLSGASALWGRYFDGLATDAEMLRFWNCLDSALEMFVERTRGGTDADVYTVGELKSFLEEYFLGGSAIAQSLLDEAIEFKRVMVGGESTQVTKSEINDVRKRLRSIRDASVKAIPSLPFTASAMVALSEQEVDARAERLIEASEQLARELGRSGRDYPMPRFEALVDELGKATRQGWVEQTRSRRPLLRLIKSLLIGPDESKIGSDQWPALLGTGTRLYTLRVKQIHYSNRHKGWKRGGGRERMIALASEALTAIERSIAKRPRSLIAFEDMDRLIDLLEPGDFPYEAMGEDREPLKKFLRPLVQRILGGSAGGALGRNAGGLTPHAIARLRGALQRWSDSQAYLEHVFFSVHAGRTSLPGRAILETPFLPGRGVEGQEAVRWIVRQLPSIYLEKNAEMGFDPSERGSYYSYEGLTRIVLQAELSRLMIQGYAALGDRATRLLGVTQPEFHCFTDHIRRIGIQTGIVDPTKYDMHETRFFEANLFFSRSDGNGTLSLPETIELFASLLSADAHRDRVLPDLVRACTVVGRDVFGGPMVSAACFRRYYFDRFEDHWRNLPGLASHYRSLTALRRAELEAAIERMARGSVSSKPAHAGDVQGMLVVSQYVESLFRRFDADRSGELNVREARAAFPVYKDAVEKAIARIVKDPDSRKSLSDPKMLESLFMYLLANGKAPDASSMQGKLGFYLWMRQGPNWKVSADRSRVFKIFGELGGGGAPDSKANWKYSRCYSE